MIAGYGEKEVLGRTYSGLQTSESLRTGRLQFGRHPIPRMQPGLQSLLWEGLVAELSRRHAGPLSKIMLHAKNTINLPQHHGEVLLSCKISDRASRALVRSRDSNRHDEEPEPGAVHPLHDLEESGLTVLANSC